jgi:opacity protein-like surface antigen
MRHRVALRVVALFVGVLASGVVAADAADRIQVVTRTAVIRAAPKAGSPVVAVVAAGTVLDVLGREDGWYRVSVPVGLNRAARPGYIEESAVRPTQERAVLVQPGARGPVAGAGAAAAPGAFRVRGFGEAAFQVFTASDSVRAIFDSPNGLFYGGGIDVTFARDLFVSVSATHFSREGERAIAYEDEVFQLGIANRVTITPIVVNVGYRPALRRRLRPYVGIGGGAVLYRERSDFATTDDNVDKTGTAVQVLGGVEVPLGRWFALGVEGQYQSIRGILGDDGVSKVFGEKDLGGFSARVKFIVGK